MSQQTIFRTTLTKEFTIYPNKLLRDKRLTFKARGLLCMVLSNDKEWIVTCGWLESETEEGRDAIRTALDELRAFGYATFKREIDDKTKRFDKCVWNFYDTPGHWLDGKKPKVGLPKDGKPSEGNPPDGSPSDGKASDKEEPAAENNQKKKSASAPLPHSNGNNVVPPSREFSDGWCAAFKTKHQGKTYIYNGKCGASVDRLLKKGIKPGELLATAIKAWSQTDEKKFWNCVHQSHDVAQFCSAFTKIQLELDKATTGNVTAAGFNKVTGTRDFMP